MKSRRSLNSIAPSASRYPGRDCTRRRGGCVAAASGRASAEQLLDVAANERLVVVAGGILPERRAAVPDARGVVGAAELARQLRQHLRTVVDLQLRRDGDRSLAAPTGEPRPLLEVGQQSVVVEADQAVPRAVGVD